MNYDQLRMVALIEVGIIAVLLIALVVNGPLTSGSGVAANLDPIIRPGSMGSELFVVDESRSAIGIR